MTIRELMQAHNLKTQDEQDELMVKLALDREALLAALKETLAACSAGMRVIADLDMAKRLGWSADTKQQRFVDELKLVGVADGFGVRAQQAIAQAEAK